MASSQIKEVLKEFEPYFNCPLVTDEQESCLIKMSTGIEIQIEIDRYGSVLVGCRLGSVLGKYRDQLFKEAMKSNFLFPPSSGVFGYSQKSKNLILFMFLDPDNLKSEYINSLMTNFTAKAKVWVEAIKSNSIPIIKEGAVKSASDNVFGLQ